MADERELESLRQENAALREQLARATLAAELYRDSTNALMAQVDPYVPPTEEELREMMEPDEGESLAEIVARYRRELAGQS
ncbi:MAG: hypothetical protein U0791_13165 [Gemmataceae bacterium]